MAVKKISNRLVYSFGLGKAEGHEAWGELLGGKGANLHGMTKLGLPVPAGFTISTDVCTYFYQSQKKLPTNLWPQVKKGLQRVEKSMGRQFGSTKNPLLVSVRSGSAVSMPGMMDTILNLGLNDQTVLGLVSQSKNPRFSYDSYRRFIAMYSSVVLGIPNHQFESVIDEVKSSKGIEQDTELSAQDLQDIIGRFFAVIKMAGHEFPQDPWQQLHGAMLAVLNSWMSARAVVYRKIHKIEETLGTAVNVQAMVFGNLGDDCGTGVAFTRDPSTGEKRFFGEFLLNAQGEDVVAGIRTPKPIAELKKSLPKAYNELERIYKKLEKHYRDMQDIEFTIERGKLFMLQTRSGKRTAAAQIRIAIEMVQEGLINKHEAIKRVQADQLDQLLHPRLDPTFDKEVIAKGLPASPGAACGQIVFDPDKAEKWVKEEGRKVILVRIETSPEDIHGMAVSEGFLTSRGGMTSHAAVVARGMGKPCIAGCNALKISYDNRDIIVGAKRFKEGDFLTLDGSTGEVIVGQVPTLAPTLNKDFKTLMKWVDETRKLEVWANADTPHDAQTAREYGAQGIGLCRTEHMFFDAQRIDAVREMILAESQEQREVALLKILPMQEMDFKGILKAMGNLPVTIRLLDPPLHEFIPQSVDDLQSLSKRLGVSYERLKRKAESLHEFNPMLGHRGCRLGISYPEIYRTQVTAIFQAAVSIYQESKTKSRPEVMIPLVGDVRELEFVLQYCEAEARRIVGKLPIPIVFGTMIELPRAALTAPKIANLVSFFSFGTNDLTQTTYGLSRDDSGIFLKDYLDAKVYEKDPFASLDIEGVGRLMQMALEEGRSVKPNLKVGICGEHGGDPASILFCHKLGMNYVSCSPYRVPIARLAAAQAMLDLPRR